MINHLDILEFWFAQAGPKKWYTKSDAFDAEIRTKFEEACIDAAYLMKRNKTHDWMQNSEEVLALIVMLDQFPRNMYRDTKGAFAWDDLAMVAAQNAVEHGHDLKTGQDRRAFFYMPYMHTEDLARQDDCVRLMDMRIDSTSSLHHAKEHRKLIAKFGRFPHRNSILRRQNTPEETEFLNQGGYAP